MKSSYQAMSGAEMNRVICRIRSRHHYKGAMTALMIGDDGSLIEHEVLDTSSFEPEQGALVGVYQAGVKAKWVHEDLREAGWKI